MRRHKKPYRIGLLFTKGSLISARLFTTERRCAASILKVNRHVSHRFAYHSLASCEQVPTAAEVNNLEGELDSTIFVLISAILNAVLSLQRIHEFNCFESPEKLH